MPIGFDGIHWAERHEAFNDMNYCRFVDEDFIGRTLDLNKWRTQIAGGGSMAITDGDANGVLRIITGNVGGNNDILDMNNIRQVAGIYRPIILFQGTMFSVAIDTIKLRLGLVSVLNTDHVIFSVDRAVNGDLRIMANAYRAAGQTRNVNTGLLLDGAPKTYAIYYDMSGKPYFYLDGVLVATGVAADINSNMRMQPYVELVTEDINPKRLDLDAVKGWTKRYPA